MTSQGNASAPGRQCPIKALPPEIVTMIAAQIDSGRDRRAFALTCLSFHQGIANNPWKDIEIDFAIEYPRPYNAGGDAIHNRTSRIKHIKVDKWTSSFKDHHESFCTPAWDFVGHVCRRHRCRDCALSRTLRPVDVLLKSQNVSKQLHSLTFRGQFEDLGGCNRQPLRSQSCIESLPLFNTRAFQVETSWVYFDIAILGRLSWDILCTLKVPVADPEDCNTLGNMLKSMSALKTLALIDLVDNLETFDTYHYLGSGILARAASLQELDISMTNFNRRDPNEEIDHEDYETFVQAKPLDLHFQALFPRSGQGLIDRNRERSETHCNGIQSSLDVVTDDRGPLRIKKLRVKNLYIPEYASHEVFDWRFLKELHLPYRSNVEQEVWHNLQCAQLESLEGIDYLSLPGAFMDFLKTQFSLEVIGFVRPPDEYEEVDIQDEEPDLEIPFLGFDLIHVTPPFGPGTFSGRELYKSSERIADREIIQGYPSLSDLLSCLRQNPIKDLRIPCGMYDITEDVVRTIGKTLPNLEHLSWYFDHVDPGVAKEFAESFLPNTPKLRRMSIYLPDAPFEWTDPTGSGLVGHATSLQRFLQSLGDSIPLTLRYVRYLCSSTHGGPDGVVGIFYHTKEPGCPGRWVLIDDFDKAEEMYTENRICDVSGLSGDEGATRGGRQESPDFQGSAGRRGTSAPPP